MTRSTDEHQARWALITGASSGIGAELARLFAADGINLVLIARREDRLKGLAKGLSEQNRIDTRVLVGDLAVHETPQRIADELAREAVEVDYLVNNAGFGTNGPFAEMSVASQLDMVGVNVTSLVHLTRLILPGMLSRRRGAVLNVASTAAFQPGPKMAVYYASKAFVLSFSEALYEECRRTGVTVTCLCPGPTRTEFAEAADMEDAPLFQMGPMSAESVAKIGYSGMRNGRPLVIAGSVNKLLAQSVRFTPRALVRQVVKRIQ